MRPSLNLLPSIPDTLRDGIAFWINSIYRTWSWYLETEKNQSKWHPCMCKYDSSDCMIPQTDGNTPMMRLMNYIWRTEVPKNVAAILCFFLMGRKWLTDAHTPSCHIAQLGAWDTDRAPNDSQSLLGKALVPKNHDFIKAKRTPPRKLNTNAASHELPRMKQL